MSRVRQCVHVFHARARLKEIKLACACMQSSFKASGDHGIHDAQSSFTGHGTLTGALGLGLCTLQNVALRVLIFGGDFRGLVGDLSTVVMCEGRSLQHWVS